MKQVLRCGYLSGVYLFLYLPLCVVIVLSFNSASHSLLWHHFSLQWYQQLFHDKELAVVVMHSLVLAITAATAAILLGMIAAVALYRYRFFGKQFVYLMLFALIVLPDLLLGIALLLLYGALHIKLGFMSLLLAHITFCLPFATVIIYNQLHQLDRYIIDAGRDLGASEWVLYADIIVPLVSSSMLAAWVLSFTLSLDDVVISYFVSGPDYEILPLRIYSMVRLGVSPEINALCSILLLVTFLLVCISQRKMSLSQRH
jgi:spermidine/putrescine transport system permease protein